MLVVFFNSCVSGAMAGGDVRLVQILKRIRTVEKVLVTPLSGKEMCVRNDVAATFLLTAGSAEVKSIAVSYVLRMLRSLTYRVSLSDNDTLFSSSDFLPDVLPAFVLKRRNPRARWVATVYHLIPPPWTRAGGFKLSNLAVYIQQAASLAIIVRWADLIQTETDSLRRTLARRYRFSPRRIIAVPSGVDRSVLEKPSDNQAVYDACCVARLHLSKGVLDLVKAWKAVCAWKEDAVLVIAGGGLPEMVQRLAYEISSSNLENNIKVLGFVSEEKKLEILTKSRLYVLASYEEGIPITFYEAMACGAPIVTYYLPSYEEIREYIVGVPVGDIHQLAQDMLRVLRKENLRQKLRDRGRVLAEKHTWDKTTERILELLQETATSDTCVPPQIMYEMG